MTSSILKEIEELHKFLEQKEYEPYQPITHSEQRTPAPPPVPAAQASIYRSHGIQSAEVSSREYFKGIPSFCKHESNLVYTHGSIYIITCSSLKTLCAASAHDISGSRAHQIGHNMLARVY